MLVVCVFVALISHKLPEAAFFIVFGLWPCVLLFDSLDNRGRNNMVMFDD